jgi:hypothetical protein
MIKTKTNSTKGEKTIKRYTKKAKMGEKKTLIEDNKKEGIEDQGSDT